MRVSLYGTRAARYFRPSVQSVPFSPLRSSILRPRPGPRPLCWVNIALRWTCVARHTRIHACTRVYTDRTVFADVSTRLLAPRRAIPTGLLDFSTRYLFDVRLFFFVFSFCFARSSFSSVLEPPPTCQESPPFGKYLHARFGDSR